MYVDGDPERISLAPAGIPNVKIVGTNEKETVIVFLAGLYDVRDSKVRSLPPTILFESRQKTRDLPVF